MKEKTKHILAWIILFLIVWLLPTIMFCAFRRGCNKTDLIVILPLGIVMAIAALYLSIREFKKEYGKEWLTPKTEISESIQKEMRSFKLLTFLGFGISILGVILGIIMQNLLLVLLLLGFGVIIALPGGYTATKWEPVAKKSFLQFVIIFPPIWLWILITIIFRPGPQASFLFLLFFVILILISRRIVNKIISSQDKLKGKSREQRN